MPDEPEVPGEDEMSQCDLNPKKDEQAWFWSGFRGAGWVLMSVYLAYNVAIVVINAGVSRWAIPDVVFMPLLVVGLYLGLPWLAIGVLRALVVRRTIRGRRGERALLVGGLVVFIWHVASYFILAE
jgi:hypothetical protein